MPLGAESIAILQNLQYQTPNTEHRFHHLAFGMHAKTNGYMIFACGKQFDTV